MEWPFETLANGYEQTKQLDDKITWSVSNEMSISKFHEAHEKATTHT